DADAPGEEIAVERVYEGVGFGVVAEEGFGRARRDRGARLEQRGELVADLFPEGAEAPAQEVLEIGLQDEAVDLDAVHLELALDHLAHLARATADEEDPVVAVGAELAQERGGAGDVLLLLGLLEGRAEQRPEAGEVRTQIGLVEIPAKDVLVRLHCAARS